MARGRIISKSLGTSSKKFAELHKAAGKLGDFAQALFPLLVVNSDDFGRLPGDGFTIKHSVFSISPHSEADFDFVLKIMHSVGLIELYEVEDHRYLQIIHFEREQPGLRIDKRTKSHFPDPNSEEKNSNENSDDGKFPEMSAESGKCLLEEKRTGREEKVSTKVLTSLCAEPEKKSANGTHENGTSPPTVSITGEWPSVKELVDMYNDMTPDECPAVKELSPRRIEKAKKYLRAFPERQFWERTFDQIHQSKFLRGYGNQKNRASPFKADFDWLLSVGDDGSENAVKTADGKYHD